MEKKTQTIGTLCTRSFSAALDEVLLENGDLTRRIKIDHPEASAILPFLSDGEILMVRQFRYALGRETLEIPAGKVDPGESPEDCVVRELLEETGHEAEEIRFVCTYAPAIGYSNEMIHLYTGHGLKRIGERLDRREISSVESLSLKDVKEMLRKGLIVDGKTLLSLSLAGIAAPSAKRRSPRFLEQA